MMKEEKINTLKAIIQECEEYEWQRRETLFEIIKDLEQEPTDKKFTKTDIDAIVKAVNKGWELRVNEVLDKIRAEIDKIHEREGNSVDCLNALDELRGIIK